MECGLRVNDRQMSDVSQMCAYLGISMECGAEALQGRDWREAGVRIECLGSTYTAHIVHRQHRHSIHRYIQQI